MTNPSLIERLRADELPGDRQFEREARTVLGHLLGEAADEIERLQADAMRWRALMRCGKIKMQGSSGVDPRTGERNGSNVHFGAEFWPEQPKPEYAHLDGGPQSTAWGVACLVALADAIIELESA